uniref:RNA polymerase II-associated factor 1 homolog n=1 Tax=Panagrellus redivivus TaxID=6233 RepID=A0A7E4UZS1_PANRE
MSTSSDPEEPPKPSKLPQVSKFAGESISPDNVRTVLVGSENPLLGNNYFRTQEQCTILLVGLNGAPKSQLIDALCNVFYGIDYKTPFRAIIANAQFDSSTPCKTITKYVFAGTRFSFQPVLIDIPDVGDGTENLTSVCSLISDFLKNGEISAINAVVFAIPDNFDDISESIGSEIQQILSILPTGLADDLIALFISVKIDFEIKITEDLFREIGIFGKQAYSLNLNSLYIAPSEDSGLAEKQEHHFDDFVLKLTLFMLHVNRLTPKRINVGADNGRSASETSIHSEDTNTLRKPSESSQKSDSAAESTSDSVVTVIQRKVDVPFTRPTSLASLTDYTYFPSTGWIPKPKLGYIPGSIDKFDLETGAMSPLQRDFNHHSVYLSPIINKSASTRIVIDDDMMPRVVTPICGNAANLTRFSSFKATSEATTISETPSHSRVDFSRNGSGRSTASEWTYVPSSGQTTFTSKKFNGFETLKPPPKPPRTVDPEFQDDEICPAGTLPRVTEEHCMYDDGPVYMKIQTRGFYPKRVPVPMKQGWGDTTLRSQRPPQRTRLRVEATRLYGASPLLRRKRRRRVSFWQIPISSVREIFVASNPCLFYCLAPIFLILTILLIVLLVVFMM